MCHVSQLASAPSNASHLLSSCCQCTEWPSSLLSSICLCDSLSLSQSNSLVPSSAFAPACRSKSGSVPIELRVTSSQKACVAWHLHIKLQGKELLDLGSLESCTCLVSAKAFMWLLGCLNWLFPVRLLSHSQDHLYLTLQTKHLEY